MSSQARKADVHKAIQNTVKDIWDRRDLGNLTVKRVRTRVEEDLGLKDGLLKQEGEWNDWSKEVIRAEAVSTSPLLPPSMMKAFLCINI